MNSGQSGQEMSRSCPFKLARQNGGAGWVRVYGRSLVYFGGGGYMGGAYRRQAVTHRGVSGRLSV